MNQDSTETKDVNDVIYYEAAEYKFRPLTEALIFGGVILVSFSLVSTFIYFKAVNAQKEEIRAGLSRTASVIAQFVDGDLHKTFDSREQEDTTQYAQAIAPLAKCLKADKTIRYVYTMVQEKDAVHFILDPTPPGEDRDEDGREDKSHIMEEYDAEGVDAELLSVFSMPEEGAKTTKSPYEDEWGVFMSGYAPFYDSEGEFVGIVGVDLELKEYMNRLEPIKRATIRAGSTSVFLSMVVGAMIWFMRNFAKEVNARRLAMIKHFAILERVRGGTASLGLDQAVGNVRTIIRRPTIWNRSNHETPNEETPNEGSIL